MAHSDNNIVERKSNVITSYNKRIWLNDESSPSTGSMVMYDGLVEDPVSGKMNADRFLRITDCYHVVKLHQAWYDDKEEFISKLRLMRDEIDAFIGHLEKDG